MCRPSGQMDKASVSGAEDWGFESPLGCHGVFFVLLSFAFFFFGGPVGYCGLANGVTALVV